MPVMYNSKKLIPAPFATFRKEFNKADDGRILGTYWDILVKGKITADRGSPNSSGVFWTLSGDPPDESPTHDEHLRNILAKQSAISKLFATEGQLYEIQPLDGSASTRFNPRIKGLTFEEGQWFNWCEYTIQMEADYVYPFDDGVPVAADKISKASEEWNLESADEKGRTYRLTHSVSAVGKRFYDETGTLTQEAWENAKDYVLASIGLGLKAARLEAAGVLDLSVGAYNYVRTQQINELGGTFSATETWLCFDAGGESPAIEDFTVNARVGIDGKSSVTIEGSINGLEVRNNTTHALTSTRWTNALAKWNTYVSPNLLTRAQNLSGLTLNSTKVGSQTGFNQNNGIITYSAEYDNRPDTVITGAINENISINNHNAADVFASIPILGRPLGPILQDIGSNTAKRRTIQIEAQMPCSRQGYTATAPDTASIVLNYTPYGTVVFLEQDEESFSEYSGRYTRTTSFTWE